MDEDVFDKREYTGLGSGNLEELVEEVLDERFENDGDEIDGLSPEGFRKLVLTEWSDSDNPIKLNTSILEGRAAEVRFVENARILLETTLHESGINATEDGNMELDTVYVLLDKMDFGPASLDSPCEIQDVLDETEARPLHVLRVVLQVAGFLEKKEGAFHTTERGEEALDLRKSAEVMKRLFVTYFREFNLAYFTRGGELPEIQALFPWSLYRLDQLDSAEGWMDRESFVELIAPPPLMDTDDEKRMELFTVLFSSRVLNPLAKFDLLDTRGFGVQGVFQINSEYHKTSLFDRFMDFSLD